MASPSRDGWKHMPPNQPRNCARCGGAVTMSGKFRSVWFKTCEPVATWHFECPQKEAA